MQEAGHADLGQFHANVFSFVPEQGIQVSELAALARVRKQTMAQAVEELEKWGYVERHPDPADRRGRLVFLTDKGKTVRPLAMAAGQQVEKEWASRTSPEQLDQLRTLLQDLFVSLQQEQ
ncbi:hypothetical protein GCM10008938_29270 [Deinococcus roseus]|uniref:HTH marR-type domain-containing protein n=1 Tax=Deinococcus roseus TaxID=392414 RepID=A0ABQ2D1A0_9DEIO|nr:hypothetical protein GCM10008938_29270 [Deinococcus roseus]